jgi:4-hydroxybenzoate polyprenyltransferase
MESLADNGVSFPVLMAYGFVIFLYIIILKLLLNLLQQMGDKHRIQKSVIDVDVHRVMTPEIDSSMQAFNVYSIATVIARGGIAAVAMAAIIVLMVMKVGVLPTFLLITIVIALLWAFNHWMKSREKPESFRGEIRKYIQKSGSVGSVIMLSIALAVLLFVMIIIH